MTCKVSKEIGGFFELDNNKLNNPKISIEWLTKSKDKRLVLSGRTAIDVIIRDVKKKYPNISSVHLPDYLCESIKIPFIDHGFEINFYKVSFKNNNFEFEFANENIELLFIIDYFSSKFYEIFIQMIKEYNPVIIHDITHSLFDENSNRYNSHYAIASIRKWISIPDGGIAINYLSEFDIDSKFNDEYKPTIDFIKAMRLKNEYLNYSTFNVEKQTFLDKYNIFESNLDTNYQLYNISNLSQKLLQNIDIIKIKNQRKNNYSVLLKELGNINEVDIYKTNIDSHTPLFCLVKAKNRDELRKYLISEKIYLPVHWNYIPKEYNSKHINRINHSFISIVIDQRYTVEDMIFISDKIKEFYNTEE